MDHMPNLINNSFFEELKLLLEKHKMSLEGVNGSKVTTLLDIQDSLRDYPRINNIFDLEIRF